MLNETKKQIMELAKLVEAKGGDAELIERALMCSVQPVSESDFDVIEDLFTELGENFFFGLAI